MLAPNPLGERKGQTANRWGATICQKLKLFSGNNTMPRSLLAGMTDYSHQSLEDILADLHDWVTNLTQVCATLEKDVALLEGKSYWEQVDYDIRSSLM